MIRQRASDRGQQTIILSLEVCDDLDATATEVLAEFALSLGKQGGKLVLARVKDRARESLMRAGLIADEKPVVPVYWSVDDAVQATGAAGH